jgi:hypothetical protein
LVVVCFDLGFKLSMSDLYCERNSKNMKNEGPKYLKKKKSLKAHFLKNGYNRLLAV